MKKSYLSENFHVLFVDDEVKILNGLSKLYKNNFNILTASSVDEASNLLANNNVGIAVVDFEMPDKNGLQLLEIIHTKFPSTRRIMLTGVLELDVVKKAINEGKVHNFVNKPIDNTELDKNLKTQAEYYLEWIKKEDQKILNTKDAIAYRKELSQRNMVLFDTLVDFEKKELNVLGTQIGEIINESLIDVYNILQTQKHEIEIFSTVKFVHIKNIIRDCELLVNKFQLTTVQLLIQLLYANIYLLIEDVSRASDRFERSIDLLERVDDEDQKEKFRRHIEEFPLFSFEENFVINKYKDHIYFQIENLLAFDATKLARFSPKQYMVQHNFPKIGYIIISKDQLPIYTATLSPRHEVEPNLITNFVIALTMFAFDVFSSEGSLNVISHDLGVILIHQTSDNILYLVVASNETIALRAGLREFAEETADYIIKLKSNLKLNENDEFILEKMNKYFSAQM